VGFEPATPQITGLAHGHSIPTVDKSKSRYDIMSNEVQQLSIKKFQSSVLTDGDMFRRAVGSWSLRLSALMDSDLAWVNGKSSR